MKNRASATTYKDPLDEIYAIRRMITEQYGPDVKASSKGILAEQQNAEEEGFVFIDIPVAHHQEPQAAIA